MWRLQVWEGKHNVEGFLLDTESDVHTKKEEMEKQYPAPKYSITIEELPRPNKKMRKIKQLAVAILDAFTQSSN